MNDTTSSWTVFAVVMGILVVYAMFGGATWFLAKRKLDGMGNGENFLAVLAATFWWLTLPGMAGAWCTATLLAWRARRAVASAAKAKEVAEKVAQASYRGETSDVPPKAQPCLFG